MKQPQLPALLIVFRARCDQTTIELRWETGNVWCTNFSIHKSRDWHCRLVEKGVE